MIKEKCEVYREQLCVKTLKDAESLIEWAECNDHKIVNIIIELDINALAIEK